MEQKTQPRDRRLGLHLTYAAGMLLCVIAFGIEVLRGARGNTLSWVYVIEWPILAITGTFLWWRLLHEDSAHKEKSARRKLRQELNAASVARASATRPDEILDQH